MVRHKGVRVTSIYDRPKLLNKLIRWFPGRVLCLDYRRQQDWVLFSELKDEDAEYLLTKGYRAFKEARPIPWEFLPDHPNSAWLRIEKIAAAKKRRTSP